MLFALSLGSASLLGDVAYITSRIQPSGAGANDNGTYAEYGYAAADTSAKSTATGAPARGGARYFSNGFTNEGAYVELTPTLEVAGGIYQIDHTFSSTAGNVSGDVVLGFSASSGCTLSFTNTDKFQIQYGRPAPQTWQLLGYLTNDPGSTTPVIDLRWVSGTVDAASQKRLLLDCFRFTLVEPCVGVAVPTVGGPLATNLPTVQVTGVQSNATEVAVYQDAGAGMARIGSLKVSNPPAAVAVPVNGLTFGAKVSATQTIGGQESCVQKSGTLVGGGANPTVRVVLSIRGNPDLAGPVGSTAGGTNSNVYFLGASALLSGACPEQGVVLYPSNGWQTVTLTRGPDSGAPVDSVVIWNNGASGSSTLDGNFGALDGIAFACEGDPGPFTVYLDDLANGTNGVVQDWEDGTPGTAYGFVAPTSSGTTSGNLLAAPNEAVVSSEQAASGSKSVRVRWQFTDGETNRWLRLVTAGAVPVQNPQLDLNEPISFRILLLPPQPLQPLQPGPLSLTLVGGRIVLDWSGSYPLQSASAITGPYTDVGISTAPANFPIGPGPVFYRLRSN
jgi:hypothetical protein